MKHNKKREPFDTTSPLLQSLEDLGALGEQYGLCEVKPFRDWNGSSWKDRVFTMRLCNAGEILDISSYCNEFPQTAQTQITKLELLIRSVWRIDGRELVSAEELEAYNRQHKTELSALEYLRQWAFNLEQIVVDRLDGFIGGLTLKQIRSLQGVSLCDNCGTTFTKVPEGAQHILYSMGEIICNECIARIDRSLYDFDEKASLTAAETPVQHTATPPAGEEVETSFGKGSPYTCECDQEFNDLESFTAHRTNCKQAAGALY